MNREKFNEMMERWLKEQKISPPSSWSSEALDWALESGLLEDEGSGNYVWQVFLTREQLAGLLNRKEVGAL